MSNKIPISISSPEFKLLLTCAKLNASTHDIAVREKLLLEGIDEQQFYSLVIRHRIAPIVYSHLRNSSSISDELKQQLKQQADDNVIKSLASKQMIISLQQLLQSKQVNGLFLKGIPIAEQYYGDISLRHTLDIDVWVEASGLDIVAAFLKSKGYVSSPDWNMLTPRQINYYKRTNHDLSFTSSQASMHPLIELHWKLRGPLGSFTLNPAVDFSMLSKQQIGNEAISVLNPVDNFLYLCTHGTEHAWFRLKWLFDLPNILSKVNFIWPDLLARAKELNCIDHLCISFAILNDLFNIEIPAEIKGVSNESNVANALDSIYRSMASMSTVNADDENRLSHLKYRLSQNKKGLFNWGIILTYLTSPNDWKLFPLPNYLFFLYFPLRPFLMVWRRVVR